MKTYSNPLARAQDTKSFIVYQIDIDTDTYGRV